jgi:hypothetical protein
MPKAAAPAVIRIASGDAFQTNALPDPFDGRDLEYRPRLAPLPAELDQRVGPGERHVMYQRGSSCTGHAVAGTINAVLARRPQPATEAARKNGQARRTATEASLVAEKYEHVSPYMLYRLARRYDEFPGEADAGSSLRGALKGWFHHGVLLEEDWPTLNMRPEPDLDSDDVLSRGAQRPLGAFYRVNPFRLDDMQSAINELNAVCVSAMVHQGWVQPDVVTRGDQQWHVIARSVDAQQLGGHAFVLVGYNDIGFLVQNSWGKSWGKKGFATLPYEDWLQSAYDAWVVRPGVPRTRLAGGWELTDHGTNGRLVTGAGPDLRRLAAHVVNLGNDGRLSSSGRFASTPAQIDRMSEHLERWHEHWIDRDTAVPRHIVLYAHGGLNDEDSAIAAAQQDVNWWLNNRVYPIYFAWQSGAVETLLNQLADLTHSRVPPRIGFDVMEAVDRGVEGIARLSVRWMWDEMKENARAASKKISNSTPQNAPGASLVVDRLREYAARHATRANRVRIHLVSHSAGAVFQAAMLSRFADAGLTIDTVAWLAPAIRVNHFVTDVLGHLGSSIRRFTVINLSDQRELDDVCVAGNVVIYRKSLLYLVSRALERPGSGDRGEVPLLGMQRFFNQAISRDGPTLLQAIEAAGGQCVFSPSTALGDDRSDAGGHGGFAGDPLTMTSVMMRILGLTTPSPGNDYRPNAALTDSGPGLPVGSSVPAGRRSAASPPAGLAADTHPPTSTPLVETAEPRTTQPSAPPARDLPLEVADAPPTGKPILDIMNADGWKVASTSHQPTFKSGDA